MEEKLTKKQKKALEFKLNKSKEEREQEKLEKKRKLEEEQQKQEETTEVQEDGEGEPVKKKRKTRRGKKGKGVNNGKGPRFILFVGNLPYDIKEVELVAHFKNSAPDRFRVRREKGIAFLEFDNDTPEIQSKMELALKMHHSMLRNRKINVELTVGGGGNSETRQQKLKEKNQVLLEQRKENMKKTLEKKAKPQSSEPASVGMHPARAALLNK